MKNIYIAFDGGGTKTNCLLSDNENINIYFSSGPSNFQDSESFNNSIEKIIIEIYHCLRNNKIYNTKLYIVGGFAGIVGVYNAENLAKKFIHNLLNKYLKDIDFQIIQIDIISDATMVLNAYFPCDQGIIAISGTGSICLAKNSQGQIFRCGGFGHLIDDIGSGYFFGKEAVKIALYSKYHFNRKSVLEEKIKKLYQIDNLDLLVSNIYKNNKEYLSRASISLFEANNENCTYAREAIMRGITGMQEYIENLIYRLNSQPLKIFLHGSVFVKQTLIKEKLSQYFKNHHILSEEKNILKASIENMIIPKNK